MHKFVQEVASTQVTRYKKKKIEIYIRGLEPYLKWYSMQPAWIQGFVAWNPSREQAGAELCQAQLSSKLVSHKVPDFVSA